MSDHWNFVMAAYAAAAMIVAAMIGGAFFAHRAAARDLAACEKRARRSGPETSP